MNGGDFFPKEREFLKDVVLLLPAIHFLVCFVYLSIYFMSFGGKLESYAGPTDIFSVSFSSIVPFYIGFAFPQLIFVTASIKRYSALPKETEFVSPPYARLLRWILLILAATNLILAGIEFNVTGIFPIASVTFGVLCLTVSWIPKILEKKSIHMREIANGLTIGLLFLIFTAVYDAQSDRYHPVNELKSSLSCGNFKILRPLSHSFLADHRNGQRAIISDECKVQALVAKPTKSYMKTSDALRVWANENFRF